MENYGAITTGAGVITTIVDDHTHQYLQIGDGVTAPDIRGLLITQGADNTYQIQLANANVLNAIAQIGGVVDPAGGVIPYLFTMGDGFNSMDSVQIQITNNGAGTPVVRAWSTGKGRRKYQRVAITPVIASGSKLFTNFDWLVLEDDNFSFANIQFANGHAEANMDEDALRQLLSLTGNLPNGVGGGTTMVIDNRRKNISAIEFRATGGGNMLVANVKMP